MMKRLFSILLLSLTLLPIAWNGINLLHYMVEHTHAFCVNQDEHTHQTMEECSTLCTLDNSQTEQQFSIQNDYQDLKTYLTPDLSFNFITSLSVQQVTFPKPAVRDDSSIRNIFRPPLG